MVVQFWFLNSHVGRAEGLETIMRIAGSLWLAMLSARSCRRSTKLLQEIGPHPWESGWDLLWHNSVIYFITPLFPVHTFLGPLMYVGETDNMQRRCNEHVIRLCATHGATQQPFFDFIRGQHTHPQKIKAAICEWLFIPVMLVPQEERKCTERTVINRVGILNPPRVYSLMKGRKPSSATTGIALFEQRRPLKRLRKISCLENYQNSPPHLARKAWQIDLQQIAAAICGHSFPGSGLHAAKAWRLEPGQWVYVVNRVRNCEEGWRRRRGLEILRRISNVRPRLPPPICIIQCRLPWIGSRKGSSIIISAVKKLLNHWRHNGIWVPILRHARIRFHWSRTTTLSQALSTAQDFQRLICNQQVVSCDCRLRANSDARWVGVTIDGEFHIATPQQMIPWPTDLSHLAHHSASITLPPKRSHVLALLRENLRTLRDRCRVPTTDIAIEEIAGECGEELLQLLQVSTRSFPITWPHINKARHFLEGLFVQYFDHNTSSIGAFCPSLVQQFGQRILDFGPHNKGLDFHWSSNMSEVREVHRLSTIAALPEHLQPTRLSSVKKSCWKLGRVKLLPKWKAPGLKWRLIIDKHSTPRNMIHSITCRAIDTVLDQYPRHTWSDCRSIQEVIMMSRFFNFQLDRDFPDGICHWTESADMCDCFHHLPTPDAPRIWCDISRFWNGKGINYITVPRKARTGRGRLGKHESPGSITLSFEDVGAVLSEFHQTNLVQLGEHIGRELRGAPMGDSLSSAVLRLFKFQREQLCKLNGFSHAGTCNKTIWIQGCKVAVLDVSFRDDLRLFCAWSPHSPLTSDHVQAWAAKELESRYVTGSMKLERSDDHCFVGLSTRWIHKSLVLCPNFNNSYNDSRTIKPWYSWAPKTQQNAVVFGLLCRAYQQCNVDFARSSAFIGAITVLLQAQYPMSEIALRACKWARTWKPLGSEDVPASNIVDIRHALSHTAHQSHSQ